MLTNNVVIHPFNEWTVTVVKRNGIEFYGNHIEQALGYSK